MNHDYEKVGIIFKRLDDGSYKLVGNQFFDSNNQNILDNSDAISITSGKYSDFQYGIDTNLLLHTDSHRPYLTLLLDKKVYEKFLEEGNKREYDSSKTKKMIQETMDTICKNIESVDVRKGGSVLNFTIHFKETKKKEDPGKSSNEVASEIDVTKMNPDELIKKIKEKVIGQDETIETIVNNIYNNQIIIDQNNSDMLKTSLAKILMDGPTGTGKTFIVTEVAKELSIPLVNMSTTSFSATGYKGNSLNDMLVSLLEKTNGNLELAERGIVILDEFDKLAGKNSSIEMKKAVQQELLTYLGGATFPVEYQGKKYDFDTSKITFICIGAFTDLRERKLAESKDGHYSMKPEDYIREGLMRELVGRFSLITATRSLNKEDYMRILTESTTSPLKGLQELGRIYNKDIIYDDTMVAKIAELALEQDTGARALQTIVNGIQNVLLSSLRDPNITQIAIDDEVLQKSLKVTEREGVKYGVLL